MKVRDELKQLRSNDIKGLISELKKYHDKLRLVYFNVKFRKQKNIKEAKTIKNHIARIWTTINEKTYNEVEAKTSSPKRSK